MSVFATEGQYARLSGLLKRLGNPDFPAFHNELVVINNAGTPTLVIGTVLGKVTATGKYKVAVQTAVDGSQTPAAIYIGNAFGAADPVTLVANTDTTILTLARGHAVVAKEALFLDATYDDATKKGVAYAALKAIGIFAEASV
jgi:hypothetical protein